MVIFEMDSQLITFLLYRIIFAHNANLSTGVSLEGLGLEVGALQKTMNPKFDCRTMQKNFRRINYLFGKIVRG